MQFWIVMISLAILAGLGHAQDMPEPGVCGLTSVQPKAANRIVNGEAAIPHSRPYQLLLVGFFSNGTAKHYCGASLVKPTHALTAAHCVVGTTAEDLRIFYGVHNFTLDLLVRANGVQVSVYFTHESYNDKTLANDVAILRLKVAIPVDNVKVALVCLADPASPVCANGDPVVASGWGSTSGSPNRTSASRPTQLQQVALKCIDASNADCKQLSYLTILGIPLSAEKSKMCAFAEYKGVCFGDSGGPLVRVFTYKGKSLFQQVGIMSGTIDCSFTKARPDVYVNVRIMHPWILNKIAASP